MKCRFFSAVGNLLDVLIETVAEKNSLSTLSFSFRWSVVGSRWKQAKQGVPDVPLPGKDFQHPPEGFWGVPRPNETCNPSSEFWVCPGVSSQLVLPRITPKGGAQEASLSDTRTASAGSFRHKGAAALLRAPSGCTGSSRYLSGRAQPPYNGNFGCFYLQSHSFSHHPQLMTTGKSWNKDQLANRLSSLFAVMVQSNLCNTADTAPDRLTVSPCVFLSLVNKSPDILELLRLGQEAQLIPFRQRTQTWTWRCCCTLGCSNNNLCLSSFESDATALGSPFPWLIVTWTN